jgi:hypothetical protein
MDAASAHGWFWHFSAVPTPLSDVGYPGHTGKHLLVLSFTDFDPEWTLAARVDKAHPDARLRSSGMIDAETEAAKCNAEHF